MLFYDELAQWWPLISDPSEYVEEVEFFMDLLSDRSAESNATLLELGSGGGNIALHMKEAFAQVTLTDIAAPMLAMSQKINPDCEHIQGDMRDMRLGRTFDVVFVHDAIVYMTTYDDLKRALETAFVHCREGGGMALFVPDAVRDTFEPHTETFGNDGDGRGVRCIEWDYDPDPSDSQYITDYVFALREGDAPLRVMVDRHVMGLFAIDEWLTLLREVGFRHAEAVLDDYERYVFVARR